MPKFNVRAAARRHPTSPVAAVADPTLTTHEGAPGFRRDPKSELFLLAVSNLVGEDTFYEQAGDRDRRYAELIARVALDDLDWTRAFLTWLRTEANMRSAPVVGALEAARALVAAGVAGARQIVASVLQRADEPGEALAYWIARHGRAIPKPVKRAVADAVVRLYRERSLLRYDSGRSGFRFGDVLELTHPVADSPTQGDLFAHALDRRHDRDKPIPQSLPMLRARAMLAALPVEERRTVLDPAVLAAAGMTWEALGGWRQAPMDAAAWTAVIPSMGYMALLRNLRNFDEAGVDDEVAATVAAKLADPAEVAASRQFPYRFFAAYEQAPSLRWSEALDKALRLSLANLPVLRGSSLVLIDTSASMTGQRFSARSTMTPAKAAAVFGVALAARTGADVHGFADRVFHHKVRRGASVIREVERFVARTGEVGYGTQIARAVRATYRGHDRVFIISDMQTMDRDTSKAAPASVPIYGFNLGGYRAAAIATGRGNRHEFGGLTDATFRMVPLLEAGRSGAWPWLPG
jgi:hypothetical protein